MASLNLIDSGIVYINPEPGYEYQFACHSHVVPLGGDDLLCTFQRGQALYSRDSVLVPSRSTDGGRNWAAETLIHDPVATRMINWKMTGVIALVRRVCTLFSYEIDESRKRPTPLHAH